MNNNWDVFLEKIKERIGKGAFDTWFSSIRFKSWDKNILTIEVPDEFFKEWIENRFKDAVLEVFAEMNTQATLVFEVNPNLIQKKTHTAFKQIQEQFKEEPVNSIKLNPRFTFDEFVIGPSNHFAYAASRAIADAPGKIHNPFFVYGKSGLGKTHLMQSIAHSVFKRDPGAKITYLSSERFMNELITAIQTKKTDAFREKYRGVDVLIIDDVHFIAGKEATQQEFFHTFNVLYDNHKQIIMSSDRPPKEISNLEERLVSRFCWGLIADIQPPDFETRVAILKKKIEKELVKIPQDVLEFIAQTITSNIRELEGALVRVMAFALIENKLVDIATTRNVLKDMVNEKPKRVDSDSILDQVSLYFNVSKNDLKSKRRSKNIIRPKQIAMYLLRELTEYSFPEIGDFLGGKDHTTIMYACKKIKASLPNDQGLQTCVNSIRQLLRK
jgi:chromosomal replication initiator protein